ncbi:MAG: polysaccharide pyruvyl transferase family protein [Clostridia bacterium]|nr:polysaccharide pyruvyl transferase family protein [Clostridia bacterium]
MRIGILTFHKVINYGAFLQSFSLSERLKKEFPDDEVEIIDYVTAPKRKWFVVLWNIKHHGIKGGLTELKRISVFNSVQKNLTLSPKSYKADELNELFRYIDERYDALIIGSDAVFNWKQTAFPTAFIPDYKFSIPVFTYAASVHGLHFYDESDDKLQKCGEIFKSMKCVGVRDNCSEKFVKLCSPEAQTMHCCDPTLFIDKEDIYSRGCGIGNKVKQNYNFSLDSKYIVVMAPDNELIKSVAQKYSGDYKIVSVFLKSSYADIYIPDLDPFEWTVILKNAQVVITSYFHGTLLSLVQSTPVIVLDYSGYCNDKYEGKLRDLMVTRLSLPELYFDKKDAENFNNNDDFYKKFDELLEGKYKESIEKAVSEEKKTFDNFIEMIKKEI